MSLLDLVPTWARLAILAALLAVAVAGFYAWKDSIGDAREAQVVARYESAIAAQKIEAARALATETNRVREAEDRLRQALQTVETQDHENEKTIERLRADLRAVSRAAGGPGLRDPWAARCGGGGGGAGGAPAAHTVDRAADGADVGRAFSSELEGLLLDQAERADTINRAYAACRQDALTIRGAQP